MQGSVSRIHPNGFFFISVKQPLGSISYFAPVSKIVSGEEYLAVGSTVSFEISPERHGRLAEACDITVHPIGVL